MKLVCIADTHDWNDEIDLPSGDLLIHAGDMTGNGTVNQLIAVNRWFGEIKENYKYGILAVPGNHDWLFEKDVDLAKTLMSNCKVLIDEGAYINGFTFYGSPQTPRFFDWAFNRDRGEDIAKYWNAIPENVQVLITHGPPHGFGDLVVHRGMVRNVGCEELANRIQKLEKLKLHVFGHIHHSAGHHSYMNNGRTQLVNAAICTESYMPKNLPIEVEI